MYPNPEVHFGETPNLCGRTGGRTKACYINMGYWGGGDIGYRAGLDKGACGGGGDIGYTGGVPAMKGIPFLTAQARARSAAGLSLDLTSLPYFPISSWLGVAEDLVRENPVRTYLAP